jgi:hypothetical protein
MFENVNGIVSMSSGKDKKPIIYDPDQMVETKKSLPCRAIDADRLAG